jgi:hypothetical protein
MIYMSSECIVSSPPGSEMMYLMMIYQIADRWFAKQKQCAEHTQ